MNRSSHRDDDPARDLRSELAKAQQRIAELEAKLTQAMPHTSVLELTVQSTTTAGQYRVKAEWNRPGDPVTCERTFALDDEALRLATSNPLTYGSLLGEALFADGVRDLFALARGDDTPLRVLLAIEAADLQRLRWDRLCGPFGDKDWRLLRPNQLTPFSLYIPSTTDRRYPPFREDELRALVVVASPAQGNPVVSWFDEAIALDTVLQGLGDIPSVVLSHVEGRSSGPPTLTEICRQLSTGGFTLLHMIFHGAARKTGETVLFLDADEALPMQVERAGKTAVVPASLLIERLGELGKDKALPHFAFLSVCDSGASEAAIAASSTSDWRDTLRSLGHRLVKDLGMKSVVAMTDKISQSTALALGRAFYPALLRHGEADVALAEACIAVREQRDVTTPTLFNRVVGRRLFTASTAARPLTDAEIARGRELLATHLAERAPVLLGEALSSRTPDELEQLCEEALEVSFAELARGQRKPPRYNAECPFPGLRAFTSAQRRYFRGRDALVATLVERMKTQPLVCVLGNSGSGKSSVVAAGVIPALHEKNRALKTARMTPGSAPLAGLARARKELGDAPETLLYIDQFEEVFTLCEDAAERTTFLDEVVAMARPERRVILTMRADFLGECATHAGLRHAVQRQPELVPPMTPDELRSAVEAQAREAGLRFETGLSERILAELVTEPGAMPLLQHALAELWVRRHGRWLRREAWAREIGGVAGAIEKSAEGVWGELDEAERALLPGVMTKLTRVGGADGDGPTRDTRQRAAMRELYAKGATEDDRRRVERLVERLAGEGARLLVTSADARSGEKRVEVAHEALLRHWPRLRDWINEAREVLLMKQDLRVSAQDWINHGKREAAFLEHKGVRAVAVHAMMQDKGLTLDEGEIRATRGDAVGSVREYFEACVAEDERAQRARDESERRFRRQVASLYAEKGISLFNAGDAFKAIAYLNEAIALGADDFAARYFHACAARASVDRVLARFEGAVAAMSPDGTRVVTALRRRSEREFTAADDAAIVWDARTGEPRVALRGHVGLVWGVAFSAGGGFILTASDDATARLWDASTGEQIATFEGHTRAVRRVAMSPDGRVVATASDDETTRLWDVDSGEEIAKLEGHTGFVFSVSFSADGERVVTAGWDGTVRVWSVETRETIAQRYDDLTSVLDACFSADGQRVLMGCATGDARIWDCSEETVVRLAEDNQGRVRSSAFDRDEARVIVGGDDGVARVWDVATCAVITRLKGHKRALCSVAFSADDTRALTAGEDGVTLLWSTAPELESGAITWHASARDAAFGLDDLVIAKGVSTGAGRDGAKLWNARTRETVAEFETRAYATSASFSPDGEHVIVASHDGTARIWDLDLDGALLGSLLRGHTGAVTSAVFSADGQLALTASDDRTAMLWDANTGGALATFEGHEGPLRSVAFSLDGSKALTASDDGTARVWDVVTRAVLATLEGHHGGVTSAAFDPGGRRVVTSGDDRTARIWDASSRETLVTLAGHEARVSSAVFSPDGARVLTASDDQTARLWDASTGELLVTFAEHDGPVVSAVFDGGGAKVLTASGDRSVRIWDVGGAGLLESLDAGNFDLTSAALTADGTKIVTSGSEGTVYLWTFTETWSVRWIELASEYLADVAHGRFGSRALVVGAKRTTTVRDLSSGAVTATLHRPDRAECFWSGFDARFSADGARVLTYEVGVATVDVWDASTGSWRASCRASVGNFASAVFSADGAHVVSAHGTLGARIWDADTGAELVALECDATVAALSHDGRRLVTASSNRTAQIWDVASRSLIATLEGHKNDVKQAAFGCDDAFVVTCCETGEAWVWDAATWEVVTRLEGGGAVKSIACSAAKPSVITTHEEALRVWNISPDLRSPDEIRRLIRERLGLELVDGKLRSV